MKALLIVDMQNDFAAPQGSLYHPNIGRIVGPIATLAKVAVRNDVPVIATVDTHEEGDPEFDLFPKHGLDTFGRGIVQPILNYTSFIVAKTKYSAFHESMLDQVLTDLRIDELIVVGNCTNICVLYTVADARNRNLPVTVVKDAVASFDANAHYWALDQMKDVLGAQRLLVDEVIAAGLLQVTA